MILIKKSLLILFVISCLFINAGCQNKRELNDLGIVLGLALDRGEKEPIKLTIQVVKPGQMKGGEEGSKGSGSFLVLTTEGKTIFDAIRNLDMMTSKKLFFSHNQVIIIGEDLAKIGFQDIVDFLERDTELRVEVPILIARGEAGKILSLPGSFEKIPAIGINKTIESSEFSGKTEKIHLYNLVEKMFNKNCAMVPTIEPLKKTDGQEMPKLSGMAIIKNGKLAGILTETESRGYLWVKGKVKSGIIVIQPDKDKAKENAAIGLEIKNLKSKVQSKIINNQPHFVVKIKETSNLGEVSWEKQVTKPEILEWIERKQDKVIADEIKSAITKAKKLNADIFGFGEEIHKNHPQQWKKLKSSWSQIFPEVKIDISVESNVQDFGDKTDPTFAKKGNQ